MSNNPDILQQLFENPNAMRRDLPKRFYDAVTLGEAAGGISVLLDGRAIKTPLKKPLVLPNAPIAAAVRAEWESQGERIDPATMPATRLANTVVDAVAANPEPVLAEVSNYVETDLLFYRAPYPEGLIERQRESWDPLIVWASGLLGVHFNITEGVMHVQQPAASLEAFAGRLADLDEPWTIAGLHQATTLSGSAIVALAVLEGHLGREEAWSLSRVDENWNIENWGTDEEASVTARRKQAEFETAALFMGR